MVSSHNKNVVLTMRRGVQERALANKAQAVLLAKRSGGILFLPVRPTQRSSWLGLTRLFLGMRRSSHSFDNSSQS